jgi:hypothetical protein
MSPAQAPPSPAPPKKAEPTPKPLLTLPTEKAGPTLTMEQAKVLLCGPPKIGKSTLASQIDPDHTLFVATEPGLGAIEAFKQDCRTWDEFREIGAALEKGNHPFKTVVIDTIDVLHTFVTEKVCREQRIKHPGDLEYGKGWGLVNDEFRLRIARLAGLGLGVWFVSHSKEVEIRKPGGVVATRFVPTLSGQPGKFITGFVDFIFFATSEVREDGEHRVLRTQATEEYEAGGRVSLPDPLPLNAAALRKAMAEAIGTTKNGATK